MDDRTKFLVCAVGIFFCYFYFAILQEKITRGRYGDQVNEDGSHGERFTFALTLVGVQCLCNWIFAKGMPNLNQHFCSNQKKLKKNSFFSRNVTGPTTEGR